MSEGGERSIAVAAKTVLRPTARRVAPLIRWLATADADRRPPPPPPVRGSTYDRAEWVNEGTAADGFPIPPRALWRSVAPDFATFTRFGEEMFGGMLALLAAAGCVPDDTTRVLDFGSGSGRFVRLWGSRAREVWGCDLNADQIRWCQEFLSPPYHFVTTAQHAHLPFEDGAFDLVYAGSVFSHIDAGADTWLLEIRRTLRAGGFFFVTILDEHAWEQLQTGQAPEMEWSRGMHPAGDSPTLPHDVVALASGPGSNVFYRRDYFAELAGRYFEVRSVTPQARGYQAALVLRKRGD